VKAACNIFCKADLTLEQWVFYRHQLLLAGTELLFVNLYIYIIIQQGLGLGRSINTSPALGL